MLSAVVPVVLVLAGALAYALAANGKAAEMGRIAFAVGLFWGTYVALGHVVRIG